MPILDHSIPYFRFFEEISAIPHGSYNESAIADYLVEFARARKLRHYRDDLNNVVIYKPASPGREKEAPVMLQGHSDMVCEKELSSGHDFLTDPIPLKLEGDWLSAEGTTLGADDGAGVSWMLAILDANDLSHPPLECVFTAAEEVGMDGARGLKKDAISAKRMIGLDGGGETGTCVSSSGGRTLLAKCPISYAECMFPCFLLTVGGLQGGHSGMFIDKEHGNAIKLGFRILYRLLERGVDIRVVQIEGGMKDNAIPRDFGVVFASTTPGGMLDKMVQGLLEEFQDELGDNEPGLEIGVQEVERVNSAMTPEDSGALISMGYLLPNGLRARSWNLGIPVISLNLGILRIENGAALFSFCVRSPMKSAREELTREIEAISSIFGGFVEVESDFPGWNYSSNSPLREALRSVLKEQGKELQEMAIHGGLETGVFKGRYPQMDIITYGPIASGAHTPEEKLDLSSFRRGYGILTRLLEII